MGDKVTCSICGCLVKPLDRFHHIKPYKSRMLTYVSYIYENDNEVVTCVKCHEDFIRHVLSEKVGK